MEKPTLNNVKQDCSVLSSELWNYILENKEWYPKRFKTYLLLMVIQAIAAVTGVRAVFSPSYKHAISIYRDKYYEYSYDPRDFKIISRALIEKVKNNPEWIDKYKGEFERDTKKFIKITDEIYENLGDKTKEDFTKVVNAALDCQSYGFLTEVFTVTRGEYWVTKNIKSLFPKISEGDMDILLTPESHSFIKQYQSELYNASSDKDLNKILDKYYWIKGSYYGNPDFSIKDLKAEKKSLKKIDHDLEELKTKKESIIKKSKNSEELRNFIHLVDSCIALQDERKENVLRLNFVLRKMINQISEIYNDWSVEELLSLSPHEILRLLDGNLTEDYKKIIKKRNHKSVWIFSGNEYCLTTDESVIETISDLFEEKESDELQGFVACGGNVRGKAKIIISEDDFHKMEKGDILITSMTRPEFIPVMKKAAAFVTDEGGITSHAAIVSREMKIPCIIGTKIATKVFKDGDLIEVDAKKGIVRKLEKK